MCVPHAHRYDGFIGANTKIYGTIYKYCREHFIAMDSFRNPSQITRSFVIKKLLNNNLLGSFVPEITDIFADITEH